MVTAAAAAAPETAPAPETQSATNERGHSHQKRTIVRAGIGFGGNKNEACQLRFIIILLSLFRLIFQCASELLQATA